jgi:hypothetical protein
VSTTLVSLLQAPRQCFPTTNLRARPTLVELSTWVMILLAVPLPLVVPTATSVSTTSSTGGLPLAKPPTQPQATVILSTWSPWATMVVV